MSEAKATARHGWVHDRRGDCAICGEGPMHENHSDAPTGNMMALLAERDSLLARNKKLESALTTAMTELNHWALMTVAESSLAYMSDALTRAAEQAKAALAENKEPIDG